MHQLSERDRQRVIKALEREAQLEWVLASGRDPETALAMREESQAIAELAQRFSIPAELLAERRQACSTY